MHIHQMVPNTNVVSIVVFKIVRMLFVHTNPRIDPCECGRVFVNSVYLVSIIVKRGVLY